MRPGLPLLAVVFATLAALAEEAPAPPKEAEEASDPRVLEDGHAPTPFTAGEIREGCPAGRVTTFRIERAGAPAVLQTMRFTTNDVAGTVLAMSRHAEGRPAPPRGQTAHATWKALQAHASFPAKKTTINEAHVKTPLGTFPCVIYEVKDGDAFARYCFARALPGPPVLDTRSVKGKQVLKMTIVEHRDGTEPALLALLGLDGEQAPENALPRLDADDSGAIAFGEFPKGELTRTQRLRAFARIDRSGDGQIDVKELTRAAKDWRPKKKPAEDEEEAG